MRWLDVLSATACVVLASGCSSSGGGSVPAQPSNGANAASSASNLVTLNATSETQFDLPVAGGITGTVILPPATGSLTLTASTSASVSTAANLRSALSAGTLNIYYEVTMTPTSTISFATLPSFTETLPYSIPVVGQAFYYGVSNPAAATPGISFQTEGPASVTGTTLTFAASQTPFTLQKGTPYTFIFYSTGGSTALTSLYFVDTSGNVNVIPTSATGSLVGATFHIPVSGVRTTLGYESESLAVDAAGTIYVAGAGTTVNLYLKGTTSPVRSFTAPLPVVSVAVDKNGRVYVLGSDGTASTLYTYLAGASQPIRAITGVKTDLTPPPPVGQTDASQVAVDNNLNMYVSNAIDDDSGHYFEPSDNGILEFPLLANGDFPADIVAPGPFYAYDPRGLAVTPDGNTIYVVNNQSLIEVYTRSGSAFSISKILGDPTSSVQYNSVTVDSYGTVYALQQPTNTIGAEVDVFAAGAANGASPLRTFTIGFGAESLTAGVTAGP